MRFGIITDIGQLVKSPNREVTHIVIHHSATVSGDAESFYHYHTEKRKWADIGYHFVVNNGIYKPDGVIQLGRDRDNDDDVLEEVGAHVLGYNRRSIGICGVGHFDETLPVPNDSQIKAIGLLAARLTQLYDLPVHRVIGHREAGLLPGVPEVHKTCPGSKVDCNLMREYIYRISNRYYDEFAQWYSDHLIRVKEQNPELKYLGG